MSNKDNKSIISTIDNSKLPKLTRKQSSFVKQLLENPKQSATQAILKSDYNVSTYNSAGLMASENLRKPQILAHLIANSERAESKIVKLLDSDKEEIVLSASKDILDRVHGKATQKIEQQNTSLNINIDLSGVFNEESDT